MKTSDNKNIIIEQTNFTSQKDSKHSNPKFTKIQLWSKLRQKIVQFIPLVITLVLWQVGTGVFNTPQLIEPALVGKPSLIIKELWDLLTAGIIFQHAFVTFQEAISGLALAMIGGISLGIALAYSPSGAKIILPYVQIFNSLPRIALAPFFIVWFGIGLLSKVLLAALAAFFPIFFTTYQGIQTIEPELIAAFQVMGANRWQMLHMVVLPSVLSWVIAGIRTSLGMALVGALVAEYIGSTHGLGYMLMAAQGNLNVDKSWAILVVLASISVFLDWGIRVLEKYILRWQPSSGKL
ncbi:ABC transporter permease [Cylindrospermopsis raciborskii CS-506_D]|uniref:ABC transporter permease n=2 Tax=Cylindrospermopsis raciborskii TaxID=77022 RepID=A0A838WKW4_9CYAN|nr:ABC transporter permease [Cylindrospermopsis raciborskii]BAZ91129.1 putative ABC transporter permease protein [Raphidiopsis curvata NIES-932]MBA4446082.1 ABC transporter permease [Cylindrospermopsis raciborskii CS-506_C]MBA4450311.1 ABC transporter permease [Cylindrospermopsis raciborskii CS-506_D]MBA4456938.1 ABC transporter permease [Cylindrospermopsis raciborskii CS-506_B]MBA4466291.1 ABC transporter permease [Cylindrospermopsis raciborskii CS-506_A]